MSINSDTINSNTIDAISYSRRNAIIQNLLLQSGGGHHPQHVNPITKNLNIFRRDHEEDNTVEVNTLELPHIAITVSMGGQDFVHTLDRGDDNFAPLINVYGARADGTLSLSVHSISIDTESLSIFDVDIKYERLSISNIRIS